MNDASAAVVAILAAFLFAIAAITQHHASSRPHGKGTFLASLFTQPVWFLGIAADAAGVCLQAWALTHGRLTIVQPLLTVGLLFALVLAAFIDKRTPSRRELQTSAGLIIALIVFMFAASSSKGTETLKQPATLIAGLVIIGVLIVSAFVFRLLKHARQRAMLLGALAGGLYGVSAALTKAAGAQLHHGLTAVLSSWPIYGLLVVGTSGFVINQFAFRAGPLAASLPAITAVDPVVSVILGCALFDEIPTGGPLAVMAMLLALAAMVWCTIGLSVSTAEPTITS